MWSGHLGVSFQEALTAFADPLARICDDEDHSVEEQREIIVGHSAKERLLVVCFTAQGESVRIFGARKATRRERKEYEENIKS
ncbi:MAG TPA: BrnT family toxin [Candidatus Limnocylindria bacterium]|nr:BrnT family toxin [Candidatus Limnocylindria bacterium]